MSGYIVNAFVATTLLTAVVIISLAITWVELKKACEKAREIREIHDIYAAVRSMTEERLVPLGFIGKDFSGTGRMCTFSRGQDYVLVLFDARENMFQFGFDHGEGFPNWKIVVEQTFGNESPLRHTERIKAECEKYLENFIQELQRLTGSST